MAPANLTTPPPYNTLHSTSSPRRQIQERINWRECKNSQNSAVTDNSVDNSVDTSNNSATTNITIHHQYVACATEALLGKKPLPDEYLPSTPTPRDELGIASSVLAAFSHAVESLKGYTSEVGKNRTRYYRLALKQFRRELETEKAIFQDAFLVKLVELAQAPEERLMEILYELRLELREIPKKFYSINKKVHYTPLNHHVLMRSLADASADDDFRN